MKLIIGMGFDITHKEEVGMGFDIHSEEIGPIDHKFMQYKYTYLFKKLN